MTGQTLAQGAPSLCPTGGAPTYVAKAKANDVGLHVMKFSDYNVEIYSNGIIFRDEAIAAHPDVVRRFVAALRDAYKFTFEHPEEAAQV